jgi:SAM-dependent methyltransferase
MSKKIRIAHFAAFCPGRTGQYATVKDMIKAERAVGIDAQFIATSIDAKKIAKCEAVKEDGWLHTKEPEWAKSADILMRHSCIPDEYSTLGIPIMMALHGRPESTFIIEFVDLMKVYQLLVLIRDDPRYKGWITFWKSHEFFHKLKVPEDSLYYVPAMIDLDEYKPEGTRVGFGKTSGSPNIIVADMWRHDMTPYAVLYAAALFKSKYCPSAKVHIFGVPKTKCDALMLTLKNDGILGSQMGLAKPMSNVYRGGDLLITPHNIATRVVRESLACGLPIVAGSSNPYTDFKADPRDIEAFAEQINRCWEHIKGTPESTKKQCRETAEKEFDVNRAGEAVLLAVEDVLRKEQKSWKRKGKPKSYVYQKSYERYGNYQKHQASKMQGGHYKIGKDYQEKYRRSLSKRLKILIEENRVMSGQSVLCLGARDGTEVQAFLDNGFFAVGLDLLPKSYAFVLQGDFQKIPYPDNALDVIFTNSIDHTHDIDQFLSEIQRVLKPMGAFIADFGPAVNTFTDRWASCRWKKFEDINNYIKNKGFAAECVQSFMDGYFVNSACYRSLGGMTRGDIINKFIEKDKYKSYLEIGSNKKDTFSKIKCDRKVSVDPYFKPMFKMTSDEYFAQHKEKFDIIFIDGLHEAEQVWKDVNNALKCLNPGGRIILHDCNPDREFLQYKKEYKDVEDNNWCGDVWKAFVQARMTRDDLSAYVINRDYGVGVLKKDGQTIWHEHIPIKDLTWDYLVENRQELLRLQEPPSWMRKEVK